MKKTLNYKLNILLPVDKYLKQEDESSQSGVGTDSDSFSILEKIIPTSDGRAIPP